MPREFDCFYAKTGARESFDMLKIDIHFTFILFSEDETGRNKFKTPRYAMSLFPVTTAQGRPLDVKFVSPAKTIQNEIHREDSAVSSFAPMSSIHSSTRLVKE